MLTKSNVRKAIETTATLIRLSPKQLIGRSRLLSLLYLADRENLRQAHRFIVGGKLVAKNCGPVHYEIDALIQGGHSRAQREWSRHFGSEAHYVILLDDPTIDALSRHEISVLNELSKKWMGYDDWEIIQETQALSEYRNATIENGIGEIALTSILDAVGLTEKKTDILKELEEIEHLDRLLSIPRPPSPHVSRAG